MFDSMIPSIVHQIWKYQYFFGIAGSYYSLVLGLFNDAVSATNVIMSNGEDHELLKIILKQTVTFVVIFEPLSGDIRETSAESQTQDLRNACIERYSCTI